MDSLVRIIRIGSYAAGVLALALSVITKIAGIHLAGATPRGVLFFAGACFFCSLASGQVAGAAVSNAERAKDELKIKTAAA